MDDWSLQFDTLLQDVNDEELEELPSTCTVDVGDQDQEVITVELEVLSTTMESKIIKINKLAEHVPAQGLVHVKSGLMGRIGVEMKFTSKFRNI